MYIMPYATKKVRNKTPYATKKVKTKKCYKVYNSKNKRVFSKCTTKLLAKRQMKLLRALQYNKSFKTIK